MEKNDKNNKNNDCSAPTLASDIFLPSVQEANAQDFKLHSIQFYFTRGIEALHLTGDHISQEPRLLRQGAPPTRQTCSRTSLEPCFLLVPIVPNVEPAHS
jgi:hypothetical protein